MAGTRNRVTDRRSLEGARSPLRPGEAEEKREIAEMKRSLPSQDGPKKRITIDAETCIGCRTCEMACSFHHTKTFGPGNASIRVCRDDGAGTVEVSLLTTCDGCPEEEVPFCVRFCSSGCLRVIS